jgi:hypothetical protein
MPKLTMSVPMLACEVWSFGNPQALTLFVGAIFPWQNEAGSGLAGLALGLSRSDSFPAAWGASDYYRPFPGKRYLVECLLRRPVQPKISASIRNQKLIEKHFIQVCLRRSGLSSKLVGVASLERKFEIGHLSGL